MESTALTEQHEHAFATSSTGHVRSLADAALRLLQSLAPELDRYANAPRQFFGRKELAALVRPEAKDARNLIRELAYAQYSASLHRQDRLVRLLRDADERLQIDSAVFRFVDALDAADWDDERGASSSS